MTLSQFSFLPKPTPPALLAGHLYSRLPALILSIFTCTLLDYPRNKRGGGHTAAAGQEMLFGGYSAENQHVYKLQSRSLNIQFYPSPGIEPLSIYLLLYPWVYGSKVHFALFNSSLFSLYPMHGPVHHTFKHLLYFLP